MQKIKYMLCQRVNIGTEEEPEYEEVLYGKKLPYSEANLELAKAESYNGEYEIFDDGVEESTEPTAEERIAALEEENAMLMECLLEMSEIVYA